MAVAGSPLLWTAAGIGAVAWFLRRPSPHFSWAELTTTSQPLDNSPDMAARWRLIRLARFVLEPLRTAFGPILVTSGYRSKAVNDAVGGSATSFHMKGSAADIYSIDGHSNETMAAWLYRQSTLPIAEVVIERWSGHLHVAVDSKGAPGARDFLQQYERGGSYSAWEPA